MLSLYGAVLRLIICVSQSCLFISMCYISYGQVLNSEPFKIKSNVILYSTLFYITVKITNGVCPNDNILFGVCCM